MAPRHYLAAGYYERSLTGLLTLLVEKGVVPRAELERRAGGDIPLAAPAAPGRANAPARERFQPGDRVHVKDEHVPGHVRMPGYIRGKTGVVVDPGGDVDDILAALAQHDVKAGAIGLTHGHIDHAGGAAGIEMGEPARVFAVSHGASST